MKASSTHTPVLRLSEAPRRIDSLDCHTNRPLIRPDILARLSIDELAAARANLGRLWISFAELHADVADKKERQAVRTDGKASQAVQVYHQ